MAAAEVAAGDRCFVEEDYGTAITHYTKALSLEPSASTYAARSNAHIKQENYVEAAQDANKALELDPQHSKAYLRKGVACYYLEEYETALQALQQGVNISGDAGPYQTWIRKCKAEIEDEGGSVPPSSSAPTAAAAPARPPAAAAAAPATTAAATTSSPSQQPAPAAAPAGAATAAAPSSSTSGSAQAAPLAPAAAPEYQGKYRWQWYQIQQKVVIDIYAKKMPADRIEASTDGTHLRIAIKSEPGAPPEPPAPEGAPQLPEGYEYVMQQELYAAVVPDSLKVSPGGAKIEITLAKADPSINWGTLHKSGTVAAPNWSTPQDPAAARQYPSSFRRNPKDWSMLEGELQEMEKKGELEDGDPLQNFFKSIFAQGDEDTRRAMMKSFVESNGTVLSTNWKEVGAKKIECTPPEGMEVHKWSENM